MIRTLAILCLSATLAGTLPGCAEGARSVAIPPAEFAPAEWESGFGEADLTTWRTGTVRFLDSAEPKPAAECAPIAGARVELLAPLPHGGRPLRVLAETTTDADGRFRLGPGPTSSWVLRVSHAEDVVTYAGRTPRLIGSFPLPEGDVDVLVRGGHDLVVRLTDERDEPLEGAEVRASAIGYHQIAVTAADGLARFRAPTGPIRVEALDARRFGAFTVVSVPAESEGTISLQARDRGLVEGRVLDAVTGEPLSGATVVHAWETERSTTTDAAGRFALETPREGRIAAFGHGHAWRSYRIPLAGEVDLRLRLSEGVGGTVVDADGEPVAAARVVAAVRNDEGFVDRVLGPLTAADGTFRFDWLPRSPRGAGGSVHVAAHRRGLGFSAASVVGPEASPVTLQLGGERALRGAVHRADGTPVPHVAIAVSCAPAALSPRVVPYLGVRFEALVMTGGDGTFALRGLPAHLAARLSMTVDTVRIERDVEPGGDAVEEIVLAAGRPISGRVVDVHGQPVTLGGEVRAELVGHPEFLSLVREAPIGPDGTFVIEDLPEGRYGIRAKVRSFDVAGAVVESGADDVVLVAEQPSSLEFELTFPDGAEAERIFVQLRDATDPAVPPRTVEIAPARTGARGKIRLVRRGRYHIIASGGEWRCRLRDVEVPDGRRPPMPLVLERTLVRRIVLEDTDGTALAGRRVVIAPVGGRALSPEVHFTGEGGATEIGGLAEGEWVARVSEDGRPPIVRRFTVATDDRSEIVLRYAPFGSIQVFVDREALADPATAVVSLTAADGTPLVAWGPDARELSSRWRLPEDGPLELRGVTEGDVTVHLAPASGERSRRSVRVEAGDTVTVRLP